MEQSWTIHNADVMEALARMPDASFDAVLSDPPYGLSFMGKAWDHGVPSAEVWAEVLRVLKPGAFLLAFGGTRTFHRLTCAIEDAGFEIRDCAMWLYGSGFPKSLNISRAVDSLPSEGGAQTPEERAFVEWMRDHSGLTSKALKDLVGRDHFLTGEKERVNTATTAAPRWAYRSLLPTAEMWARIRPSIKKEVPAEIEALVKPEPGPAITHPGQWSKGKGEGTAGENTWSGYGTALKPAWEPCIVAMKPLDGTFAENALRHGVAGLNIEAGRIPTNGETPKGSGDRDSWRNMEGRDDRQSHGQNVTPEAGRWPANLILDREAAAMLGEPARFFYTAKASRRERDAGLAGFEEVRRTDGRSVDIENPRLRTTPRANHHPCLKPLDLNRYLASLILPPERDTPRRILVPFSGSGSEMIGALLAGWDEAVGIEREADYCAIAEARLAHWVARGALDPEPVDTPERQGPAPASGAPEQPALFPVD